MWAGTSGPSLQALQMPGGPCTQQLCWQEPPDVCTDGLRASRHTEVCPLDPGVWGGGARWFLGVSVPFQDSVHQRQPLVTTGWRTGPQPLPQTAMEGGGQVPTGKVKPHGRFLD